MNTNGRIRSLIFTGHLSHNAVHDTIEGDPVYKIVAHYATKLSWYSRVNFEAGMIDKAVSEKLIQLHPHTVIPETVRRLTVPAVGGRWPVASTVDSFMANLYRSRHLGEAVYLRVDFIE